jgi:hypothetical protein
VKNGWPPQTENKYSNPTRKTMKLTLESTPDLFTMAPGIQYRVWRGVTDGGVRVEALITHIVPLPGQDKSSLKELAVYPRDWRGAFQNQEGFYTAEDCEFCKNSALLGRSPETGECVQADGFR